MDSENFISAAEFARRMSYYCSQSLWVKNDSDSMLLFPARVIKRCKESPLQIDWDRISVKEASQKQKDLTGAFHIIYADDVPVLYFKVKDRWAYWMPDVEELYGQLSYMTVFDIADRIKSNVFNEDLRENQLFIDSEAAKPGSYQYVGIIQMDESSPFADTVRVEKIDESHVVTKMDKVHTPEVTESRFEDGWQKTWRYYAKDKDALMDWLTQVHHFNAIDDRTVDLGRGL